MLQLVQVRIFSSSFWVQCTNSSACMERQVPLTKRFSPIVLPDPLSISLSLQCLGPFYKIPYLLTYMHFSEKALAKTGYKGVQLAMDW